MFHKKDKQKSINNFYWHATLSSIAYSLTGVFGIVFLLKIGLSIPQTALVTAGIYAARFLLRKFIVKPFLFRFDIKASLILSLFIYAFHGFAVLQITEPNYWILIYGFCSALAQAFYWGPFHMIFSEIIDHKHPAHQTAVMFAFRSSVSILTPLISGLIALKMGIGVLFVIGSFFFILSSVPLFFVKFKKSEFIPFDKIKKDKVTKNISLMYFGNGLFSGGEDLGWKITVFLFIGDLALFGGLLSASALIVTVLNYVISHQIDKGKSKEILNKSFFVFVVHRILRYFISTPLGLMCAAPLNLGTSSFLSLHDTVAYREASLTKNRFFYHYRNEVAWDFGYIIICLFAALVTYLGFNYRLIIFTSILGGLVMYFILLKDIHRLRMDESGNWFSKFISHIKYLRH